MTIEERIFAISNYFVTLNCSKEEEAVYVLVRLPETWKITNETKLKENYGVQVGIREEGCYFVGDINNGIQKVFDAIDYVIKFNLNAQERKALFEEKVEELKTLFRTEDLSRLKTLEFTMTGVKVPSKTTTPATTATSKGGRRGRNVVNEILNNPQTTEPEKEKEKGESTEELEFDVETNTQNAATTTTVVTNGDNDLMQMAKEAVKS